MTSRSQQPSATIVLAVVAAVVALGLLADVLVEPVAPTVAAEREVELLAGSTTCAALALDEASDVTASSIAWLPDETGEGSATLQLESGGDGRVLGVLPTDGGAEATAVTGDGTTAALTARWEQTPLLLARRWSVDETQRVPGTVEGPCPAGPATEWIVPGVTTAGGAAAVLHVANPTAGSASLSVSFTTPDGPVAPTRLANLAVEANGQVTVDLNQFVPEEPDLGVIVRTRAGRVVAEVVQTLEAAVGGVDGRSLVAAHPAAAEAWTIPWVRSSDQETAWVWVTNPGEAATDVRLVLHTADGPVVPPDSGLTLPPGSTQRIDLRGALAEVGTAAVTVRSAPGVPIVANAGVLRAVPDDSLRSGVTVVEALPASSGPQAALSAVGGEGRERTLALANPGDEAATVDVRVVGRNPATARLVATGLVLPAGASTEVQLAEDLPLEGAYAIVVVPTQGAVAATLVGTSLDGPLDLVSMAARPFPTTVTVRAPTVVRDRTLLHPLDVDALTPAPDPATAPDEDAPVTP